MDVGRWPQRPTTLGTRRCPTGRNGVAKGLQKGACHRLCLACVVIEATRCPQQRVRAGFNGRSRRAAAGRGSGGGGRALRRRQQVRGRFKQRRGDRLRNQPNFGRSPQRRERGQRRHRRRQRRDGADRAMPCGHAGFGFKWRLGFACNACRCVAAGADLTDQRRFEQHRRSVPCAQLRRQQLGQQGQQHQGRRPALCRGSRVAKQHGLFCTSGMTVGSLDHRMIRVPARAGLHMVIMRQRQCIQSL